ncbi:MAG TPA: AI-2E family transporter [Anaerolineaceae bacterium]|nr:AI-2E family transporter [Anaerolineaceae bacterium]HQF44719.1 AI-2E family transporter [Anaerolineaceae bacterium]
MTTPSPEPEPPTSEPQENKNRNNEPDFLQEPGHVQVIADSPPWSNTVKLVVGLTMMAIAAGLLIRFRNLIGPLLLAFVLAYLIHPVASWICRKTKFSWRLTTTIIFILILFALIGLLTWGGFSLVGQVQSLINFVQRQVDNFPIWLDTLTAEPIYILGIFEVDLRQYDFGQLAEQALGMVEPILSRLGSVVGSLAGGAATTIGYAFFTILVAYFFISETGGVRARLINIRIPGYSEDLKKISTQLNRIWNAFLRGQIIIFLIAVATYTVVLGILGVNFYLGLAFLAGFARFIPYVGAWVTWITLGLVCYFQSSTLFGVGSIVYVIIVVGIALVIDSFFDNFVVPRLMADALSVHPAAVMVAALVSAQLFGIIGVLLAAPTLATLQLISRYVTRKLFDLDPWHDLKTGPPVKPMPKSVTRARRILKRWLKPLQPRWKQFVAWFNHLWMKVLRGFQKKQ